MFGTRSDEGERAVERPLTIVQTCQLQQLTPSRASRPQSLRTDVAKGSRHCYGDLRPLNCYKRPDRPVDGIPIIRRRPETAPHGRSIDETWEDIGDVKATHRLARLSDTNSLYQRRAMSRRHV